MNVRARLRNSANSVLRFPVVFGWLPLFLLAASLAAQDAPLLAGLAKVEITPASFGEMYGYRNRRCGPAVGTHDPLFAKVLYLQAGEARMAIVTMDLGSIASTTLFERAAKELGIPLLLLAASHTHSAPAFLPPAGSAEPPAAYLAELEGKILLALKEAAANPFPAALGVGYGEIPLGYNRLLVREDGRARAVFDNLDRVPYGPIDPEFTLLRVSDLEGRVRALIVHYATHPVVLGPSNCLYSADFPGVLQTRVESAIPGVQAMFVQGAAGSTNPLFQGRSGDQEKDFETVSKMGNYLADKVLQREGHIEPIAESSAKIRYQTSTHTFSHRWDTGKTIAVGISTVLIGDQIAIATVPGEPFLAMQSQWKQDADVRHPLFYGYTQSTPLPWPGYIPDIRSAAYGGYGAGSSTNIAVGAAEEIMKQHRIQLYGLKNMWLKEPGPN